MKRNSIITASLLIGGGLTINASAQQIGNGSFDDLNGAAAPNPSSGSFNSISPSPWTNVSGSADWFNPNPAGNPGGTWDLSRGVGASPDAGPFQSARAFSSTSGETFQQANVTGFTVGQVYTLSFYQTNAGNGTGTAGGGAGSYNNVGAWKVTMFGASQDTASRNWEGVGNQTWDVGQVTFTANATSTNVRLMPISPNGGRSNMALDGVTIEPGTVSSLPEPSSALLSILGALTLLRRKR